MGFLSRKNKFAPAPTEDERHPIVEELERMEEVIPETPPPAGPVAQEGTSSSQAAGDVPSSTPPAGEAIEVDVPPSAPEVAEVATPTAPAAVAEKPADEPE